MANERVHPELSYEVQKVDFYPQVAQKNQLLPFKVFFPRTTYEFLFFPNRERNHELQFLISHSSDRLHVTEGFVPLVHWSAESDKENSHLNAVECVQGWAKKWTPGCENF